MKHQRVDRMLYFVWVVLSLSVVFGLQPAWAGPMRIVMADGRTVDVPYYWEEAGEIKFEIAGGVVGIPKGEVASVKEILASREFDPEVLIAEPKDQSTLDHKRALEEIVASRSSGGTSYQKLTPEESDRLLKLSDVRQKQADQPVDRVYGPIYRVEGDFAELVKTEPNGVMLVMRNILNSRVDLRNYNFVLTLYDGEGNVLQQKPCEVRQLDVDQKTLKKLEVRGNLYSVMGMVKPDSSIKKYDITSTPR